MILETSRDDYLPVKFRVLGGYNSIKLIQSAFNNLQSNAKRVQRSSSIAELNRCTIGKHLSIRRAVTLSNSANAVEMQPA